MLLSKIKYVFLNYILLQINHVFLRWYYFYNIKSQQQTLNNTYIPSTWLFYFWRVFYWRGEGRKSLFALVSMPRLSPIDEDTHNGKIKKVAFYKFTSNIDFYFAWSFKKRDSGGTQDRRPTSLSRYVTEFGNGRPDIDPWLVRRRWLRTTGVVSPHRLALARAVPSNANRAFTTDFCGGKGWRGWTRPFHSRVDASSISNDEDETHTRTLVQTGR